jgi:hypothetical protein
MTNEQINIAIAMLRGWKFIEDDTDYEPYWEDPAGNMIGAKNMVSFPNSAGCLNAMHDAEKWLMHKEPHAYMRYVDNIYDNHSNCIHLTARIKAEEFLQTLGKWEEKA